MVIGAIGSWLHEPIKCDRPPFRLTRSRCPSAKVEFVSARANREYRFFRFASEIARNVIFASDECFGSEDVLL